MPYAGLNVQAVFRPLARELGTMRTAMMEMGDKLSKASEAMEDARDGKLIENGVPLTLTDAGVIDELGRMNQGRGDDIIRAMVVALGVSPEQARSELQTVQNAKWSEAMHAPRKYKSKIKRYSYNVRVSVGRDVIEIVLNDFGWVWVPTKEVGKPVEMHARYEELPEEALVGSVILRLSSDEYVAVMHGVAQHPRPFDRNGTRAVYGYFAPAETVRIVASMRGTS